MPCRQLLVIEASLTVRDREGNCRLHFTVSDAHLESFRARLAMVQPIYEARLGTRFEIGFSATSSNRWCLASAQG